VDLRLEDQKSGEHGSVPVNRIAVQALKVRKRCVAEHCPDSPWVFCNAGTSESRT
jgi:hypothetical protein